ncbi:L-lactate dehydrogenase complex protein LldG [Oceanobacillus limi]|uniref:Lactate utilization protein C n=1 Tax=Oceanobacillus limi TaxID=930131 RepID=A0A1I0AG45_9BACI|nr:lactate utilization protein C [Oceanobacillus limi]SES93227.1 L-lactate dehydrogenase complex protein LldG [Oceanobacillus limi]
MTIKKRERFLENLASNLGRPRVQKVERPQYSVSPQQNVYRGYSMDDLMDVLEKQCKAIHTDFINTDTTNLGKILLDTIEGYNGNAIITANDPRFQKYGIEDLFDSLRQDGKEVHVWNSEKGKDNQVFAESADVGITFSDITLAESGTVTLFNDKNNGRSISLLPKTYIALIPKETIVPRMTQAAQIIQKAYKEGHAVPSCISFITGPSNSADIEMNLIVGVHGPIKVTYIAF